MLPLFQAPEGRPSPLVNTCWGKSKQNYASGGCEKEPASHTAKLRGHLGAEEKWGAVSEAIESGLPPGVGWGRCSGWWEGPSSLSPWWLCVGPQPHWPLGSSSVKRKDTNLVCLKTSHGEKKDSWAERQNKMDYKKKMPECFGRWKQSFFCGMPPPTSWVSLSK